MESSLPACRLVKAQRSKSPTSRPEWDSSMPAQVSVKTSLQPSATSARQCPRQGPAKTVTQRSRQRRCSPAGREEGFEEPEERNERTRERREERQSPTLKYEMKYPCDLPLSSRSRYCRPTSPTRNPATPTYSCNSVPNTKGRSASAGEIRQRCSGDTEGIRRSCVDELLSRCRKINNIDGMIFDVDYKSETPQRTRSTERKTSLDTASKASVTPRSSSATHVRPQRPLSANRMVCAAVRELQAASVNRTKSVRSCQGAAAMHTVPERPGKEAAAHSIREKARPWRPN